MHTRPIFPSGWSSIQTTPANLTLANTLPVGQSFLWHRHSIPDGGTSTLLQPFEEYSRAAHSPPRVICLRQSPTHLYYTAIHPTDSAAVDDLEKGTTKRWVDDYFQLETYPDLTEMYMDWRSRDPGLFGDTELNARAIGVRLLRQDPWECLVAFISSTNNNIPRITSLMHRLSKHFSPPLLTLGNPDGLATTTYHTFPDPHLLPRQLELVLREMGFGYRAGFIESSLETLRAQFGDNPGEVEVGLHKWRTSDIDEVREKLLELKGIGRKVADCVMLMCLDQPSLIPVDTHVGAIAARHPSFPNRLRNKPMSKQLYDEIQSFLLDKWGPLGGWCQAVMFAADLPVTTTTPRKVKVMIKPENPPASPISTALVTPVDEKPAWPDAAPADSPSKGREKRKPPIIPVDMPAGYGFKRTRSAARIELQRSSSSVSAVAEAVKGLEVD